MTDIDPSLDQERSFQEAELEEDFKMSHYRDRDLPPLNLAEAIGRRFAPLGGVDLELPAEEFVGTPPLFDQ